MEVIKSADWVIDLGPDGGVRGGQIIATGTPEQVADNPNSLTGKYLAHALETAASFKQADEAAVQPIEPSPAKAVLGAKIRRAHKLRRARRSPKRK
jgi:hypothetical protein